MLGPPRVHLYSGDRVDEGIGVLGEVGAVAADLVEQVVEDLGLVEVEDGGTRGRLEGKNHVLHDGEHVLVVARAGLRVPLLGRAAAHDLPVSSVLIHEALACT